MGLIVDDRISDPEGQSNRLSRFQSESASVIARQAPEFETISFTDTVLHSLINRPLG